LSRGDRWDAQTYGIPIPQVDQMPAGLMSIFIIARNALRRGRTVFTPAERAHVELARYRCFLLGLPRDLLADTPQAIVDLLLTRHCAKDSTTIARRWSMPCSRPISPGDHSLRGRLHTWLERGFAKVFFVENLIRGGKTAAANVGIDVGLAPDYIAAAVATVLIAASMAAYDIAARLPFIRDAADRALVRTLTKELKRYGQAQPTANAQTYRPAHVST
jgi:hypothetical protein